MIQRRHFVAASLAAFALAGASGFAPASAQQQFFRIGTGGTAGTYYPVGGMIANAISTDKLVSTAVATNGSVANVNGIVGGSMESGFSQADVATWAYTGTGIWEGRGKVEDLRAIANLYPESVHLVVRKGLNVKSPADLKGKRVSLDEPGSGTLVNARTILAALRRAGGRHQGGVRQAEPGGREAPRRLGRRLLLHRRLSGGRDHRARLRRWRHRTRADRGPRGGEAARDGQVLRADEIPAGTYKDIPAVPTVAVGAQWVTSAKVPADVVYEVTKALWSDKTRAALDGGHAKGKAIRRETALLGLGVRCTPAQSASTRKPASSSDRA